MTLSIVFAHGGLEAPARGDGPDIEARAWLRAAVHSELPEREARVSPREPPRLTDAMATWHRVALPAELVALFDRHPERSIDVALPGAVREELERRAPRTWASLFGRTRLLERDGGYCLRRTEQGFVLQWRPAGDAPPVEHTSALLQLGDQLARGALAAAPGAGPATLALVAKVLEARWLARRLAPELHFDARRGGYRLRGERSAAVWERGPDGAPGLFVELEDGTTAALDESPGAELPLGVVRAGLHWLLGAPPVGQALYLDSAGTPPREAPRTEPANQPQPLGH